VTFIVQVDALYKNRVNVIRLVMMTTHLTQPTSSATQVG